MQRQESVRSEISDDVFYENQLPTLGGLNSNKIAVVLGSVVPPGGGLEPETGAIPQRRGTPSLTVNIPHPAGSRTQVPAADSSCCAIPVIVDEEEEGDFFTEVDGKWHWHWHWLIRLDRWIHLVALSDTVQFSI